MSLDPSGSLGAQSSVLGVLTTQWVMCGGGRKPRSADSNQQEAHEVQCVLGWLWEPFPQGGSEGQSPWEQEHLHVQRPCGSRKLGTDQGQVTVERPRGEAFSHPTLPTTLSCALPPSSLAG